MGRYFNTEGRCRPDIHYMVRLDDRLDKIKRLYVDRGKYFVINRGRQYGKTTTLMALSEYLKDDYAVISMDFQMLSTANFANEEAFVIAFIEYLQDLFRMKKELSQVTDEGTVRELIGLKNQDRISMDKLFRGLSLLCEKSEKPIVLMIDEVDSASNHRVFLDFLAMLRGGYLDRENRPMFQAVILAGVYDIKNLKLKLRPEEEQQYNSPWNIAARFNVDMDFLPEQIACMLQEYEGDHQTGMDISSVSRRIYEYTSGYPYLVSVICKFLDEEVPETGIFGAVSEVWTERGIAEAVKILLKEKNPLFDSMTKYLDEYRELRMTIQNILYRGKSIPFNSDEKSINVGLMFGFLKEKDGQVAVANRIFEMRLLNLFITEESVNNEIFFYGQGEKNHFLTDGRLNMKLVLEKFAVHFTEVYGGNDEKFVEAYGRKFFLLYLKPIINGVGNYYIEAQTRDAGRTDLIVDYRGEQFVVELKIWRGNEYNERGEKQLLGYLDYFHLDQGYMLSFNFNKKKETGVKTFRIDGRTIVEAVV